MYNNSCILISPPNLQWYVAMQVVLDIFVQLLKISTLYLRSLVCSHTSLSRNDVTFTLDNPQNTLRIMFYFSGSKIFNVSPNK